MKDGTKDWVLGLARAAARTVKSCVERGMCVPEYEGEKPTPDRIRKSVRRAFGALPAYRNVFKTRAQYELFDAYVYQRLRRDGVLKLMRPGRDAV